MKNLHINPNRHFDNGMAEVFQLAGLKPPRTFERMNKIKRQEKIINFIRKNPKATCHIIAKNIKMNISASFKNIKEAYEKAGVNYTRERSYKKKQMKKEKL